MITIGYCTRESNKDHEIHLIKTCGLDPKKIQVIEIVNVGDRSLTNCYNEIINKAKYDIVVFCHSDIVIETKQWGSKLLKLFNKNSEYGVIGVAGTKYLADTGKWWENTKKMYGRVAHTHNGKTWLSSYSNDLGQSLEEVVIVDGVFFAINKTKIKKVFNEDFKGFHFYDVSFCFDNFINNVKIGVTTMIRINHKSIGMTNDQWEENRLQFVDLYQTLLPVTLKRTIRKNQQLNILLSSLYFNDNDNKSTIIYNIANKLAKTHNITICSIINGKLPLIAKRNGIKIHNVQDPPGYKLGDGKWKLKTNNGEIPSQPNVLYKTSETNFDLIHVFDDELIEHMNKLYNGIPIINSKFLDSLILSLDKHPLVNDTINFNSSVADINIDNIVKQYIDNL